MTETFYATQQVRVLTGHGIIPAVVGMTSPAL